MTQITLRGIDDEVEKKIRRMAKEKGTSVNKVILELIHQQAAKKHKRKEAVSESLKKLAGTWTKKQAADFMESIRSCEQIDEAVWN
jgi:ribosomal protein L5